MAIEIAQDLVRIPSYSDEEGPALDYIDNFLGTSGIDTIKVGNNLVVRLKGKDSARAFIFNGHVDVVSTGDSQEWDGKDPWSGKIEDGYLRGRGSADMKGGVAAMMELAVTLSKDEQLPTDVWFSFVSREEIDGNGTRDFLSWFRNNGFIDAYEDLAVIIGEPTTLDRFSNGHRGNFFLKATAHGDAGHSSRPDLIEINPVYEMCKFIDLVNQENVCWQEGFEDSQMGKPSVTVTSIEANSGSSNRTASSCVVKFDLRTIPNFHEEAVERLWKMAGDLGIALENEVDSSPFGSTSPDSKIVQVMRKLYPGKEMYIFEGATDLAFFSEKNIDGIIFGPGNMNVAHRVNEHAPVEEIEEAPRIYKEIYYSWAQKNQSLK